MLETAQQTTIPLFKVFMPPTAARAVEETLFSGYIAEGPKVAQLTKLIANHLGNPRTVLVNSCTTALTMAFHLAGVGPGTEVITTPLTCVASNAPILSLGGFPIWVDVDPKTGMVDPDQIDSLITRRTRAILVLHKEGDPARLNDILPIARKHGIKVIEDAAHAFGTKYRGVNIGNHGDYVCFSFQAIKHMTTGDGGALLCKSDDDYLRARKLKWFGVDKEMSHGRNPWLEDISEAGYKGNMNDIAASIGIEQMKHIDAHVQAHHNNGKLYDSLLSGVAGLELINRDPADYSAYWAYCLTADNRDGLMRRLEENGISSAQVHPRNDVYSMFSPFKRHLPQLDTFAKREFSLPCGWWVRDEDVHRICTIIKGGW